MSYNLMYLCLFSGDLLYYGGVEWLNISDFLGKIKKGLELHAMCFVFKSAVVFLCKERLRQKKKLMVRNYVGRYYMVAGDINPFKLWDFVYDGYERSGGYEVVVIACSYNFLPALKL